MSRFECSDLSLLLFQLHSRIRELTVQKSRRALGKLLLGLKILVDKKRGKLAVYLLCELRGAGRISNLEGSKLPWLAGRLHQIDLDVLSHLLNRILGLGDVPPTPHSIKMESVDRGLQAS